MGTRFTFKRQKIILLLLFFFYERRYGNNFRFYIIAMRRLLTLYSIKRYY